MLVNEIIELNCNAQELNINLKDVLKILIDKKHQDRQEVIIKKKNIDYWKMISVVLVIVGFLYV